MAPGRRRVESNISWIISCLTGTNNRYSPNGLVVGHGHLSNALVLDFGIRDAGEIALGVKEVALNDAISREFFHEQISGIGSY
jgi:hypothetical protein